MLTWCLHFTIVRRDRAWLTSCFIQPRGLGIHPARDTLGDFSMNTKMKVLSLALIGAFGYVGSAAAGTCPAGPTVPDGGAWTSSFVAGGSALAIVPGGLEPASPSACKATSALGASITAAATVTDDTPADEPSYRFQFLVDPSAVTAFGATDSVVVFRANANAAANGRASELVVY